MSYYIGIDLGTSAVKICLIDEKGNLIKEDSRSYKWIQPVEGWKEISTKTWWNCTCDGVKSLLDGVDSSKVKGIGVTGQMHSLVLLDQDGRSIRPVIMWNDTRTASLISELKEIVKGTEVEYLNNIITTGSPVANLLWMKKNEYDNFKKIRKFLIGPDYIVYRLTGTCGTDYCEASTSSMYDTYNKCWSSVIREYIGVSEDVYPEVKESTKIAGRILPDIAKELGLSEEVDVIVGTGDNPAASIPTGCLGKNYPVFSMGTSGVLMFPRDHLDYSVKGKNILFSFDKNCCKILVQGVIQSCGSSYSWWNDNILNCDYYMDDETVIDYKNLGKGEVLFYPHLSGDKTIYADPLLRGAFIGLGTSTSKSEMTLAVMEGIAFALRQLSEEMRLSDISIRELRVIGGGSKNRLWMQVLSDVMKTKIVQLDGKGGAGYGVALLTAYACGEIKSPDKISESIESVKECFYPRSYNMKLYDDKYEKYKKIHDALLQIR